MAELFDIQPATETDLPLILDFIQQLADYEREPDAVVATVDSLRHALFCESPKVFAIIARDGETPIGFAVYFFNFSTWLGKHGLYLEDLFVSPDQRGRGAGKQLLQHLAGIAVERGCGRFEWSVLDWNQPAIDFYESFGAEAQSEWSIYRLSGDPLLAFAKDAVSR